MFSSTLYKKSPIWLQECLISLRSFIRKYLREDAAFKALLLEAEINQYKSAEQLEALQTERLDLVLNHAQKNIAFYQNLKLKPPLPTDVFKKVTLFPIIAKPTVFNNPKAFLGNEVPKAQHIKKTTSGTTGIPINVFQTLNSIKQETAFVERQRNWAGYKQGDKVAWMRGDCIVPVATNQPPFWRMDKYDNTLMLSSFHLSEKNAPLYLDALRKFNPAIIQAYPFSIVYLANWLFKNDQTADIPALKSIITSSETLLGKHRERIESSFGVRVFDWYGSVERVAAIGTCEAGNYHIIEDYGYTELLPTEGGLAEIVGTSFHNPLMPLIRYNTGDLVELEAPNLQCPCKRAFRRVKRIIGRVGNAIVSPDGITLGAFEDIFYDLNVVQEYQLIQETDVNITLLVALSKKSMLSTALKSQLIDILETRIGSRMIIDVIQIEAIPRTKNGKLISIINRTPKIRREA